MEGDVKGSEGKEKGGVERKGEQVFHFKFKRES